MMAIRGVLGTIREIFEFLWARRLWWMIPFVMVLLLFGAVIILGGAAGVGPFIYTLF